jgi:hypothetical protein
MDEGKTVDEKHTAGLCPSCPHSKRTKTTCKCTTPNPGAVVAAGDNAP